MLQANGQISLSQIGSEFGDSPPYSMSEYFGVDAGVPSSGNPINLAAFFSKGNAFAVSITSNQLQLNLRTWLLANGWDGNRLVKVTIESGIYIWSDNTSVPALDMGGTYPNGLTIINKGFIIGKGGNGGSVKTLSDGNQSYVATPTPGGPALNLTGPVTIDNNDGYIGGGGGGGAASWTTYGIIFTATRGSAGGGGAGGGLGGVATSDSTTYGGPASSTPPPAPGPGGLGTAELTYRAPVDVTYGVPSIGVSGGAGGSGGVTYTASVGGSV